MTTVTRDTHTEPQTDDLFPVDDVVTVPDRLPFVDDLDPTRVRLTGMRPAEWPVEAACFGKASAQNDPWHPGEPGEVGEFSPHARQTCVTCPVRLQCLALGLAMIPLGGAWGMFGGFTPAELRAIARKRGMADRVVAQHGTRARRVAGCDCTPCKRAHAEYVAELRALEKFAEADAAEAELETPDTTPTITPLPDLFDLLMEVSA